MQGKESTHSVELKDNVSRGWVTTPVNDRLKTISKDMYLKYRYYKFSWNNEKPSTEWGGRDYKSTSIPDYTWNLNGTQLGEPILADLEPLFFGKSILTNDTPIDQTLQTDSFTKTVSTTNSTTTSPGFNIGLGDITIPIVSKLGKIEMTFNTNNSDNTTTSEVSRTSTSQSVFVPTGKIYEVQVYLLIAKYRGKVSLKAESIDNPYSDVTFDAVKGGMTGGYINKKRTEKLPFISVYEYGESNMFSQQGIDYNYWKQNGSPKIKLYVDGEGDYTFQNGSQFEVKVTDITDSLNPKLVRSYELNN